MDLSCLHTWQGEGLARESHFRGKPGWQLLPGTAEDVARLLHGLQENGLRVAMAQADAASLGMPLWLDMRGLSRVRKHPVDDFIIEVETGLTWKMLGKLLTPFEQDFPLHYLPDEPVLAALAEDRPALETGLLGYLRDSVLKVEIATPDGQLTVTGADVVKNVTGYDLGKLYVGGQHAFGVMTAVTLKLSALPAGITGWRFEADSLETALHLAKTLIASALPLRMAEIVSPARLDDGSGWHLLVEVAGDAQVQAEAQATLPELTGLKPKKPGVRQWAALRESLQGWPETAWVLEAALPLGALDPFLAACPHDAVMQVRPAAGLVQAAFETPGEDGAGWVARARAHGGFAQWIQTPYYHPDLIRRDNLPENPVQRSLLNRLKTGYDPRGVLFTPRLPFDPQGPGHERAHPAAAKSEGGTG